MITLPSVVSRSTLLILLTCGTLVLGGCGSKRKGQLPKPDNVQNTDAHSRQEALRLAQCQRELEVLKSLNPEQHTALRQTFNQLMSGAAQYSGLRTQVNAQTQETVDALYRYKINRLCANIAQATLADLAKRGEVLE